MVRGRRTVDGVAASQNVAEILLIVRAYLTQKE